MLIRLGYDIRFEIGQPVPMVTLLSVHPSRRHDLKAPDRVIAEPALNQVEYTDSFGNICTRILAPAGTPPAIIARLQAEFTKAVQSDDVVVAFAKIGAEPITNTPQAFAALMASDIAKLAPIVKESGATAE